MTHWASLPTDRILAAINEPQHRAGILVQCPECDHGTQVLVIYARRDQIRVAFTDATCGCDIGTHGRLLMAAAALKGAATDPEGNSVEGSPV